MAGQCLRRGYVSNPLVAPASRRNSVGFTPGKKINMGDYVTRQEFEEFKEEAEEAIFALSGNLQVLWYSWGGFP